MRDAIAALPGHVLGAVGSPGAEATLAAWTHGEAWLAETRAHLTAMRDHAARAHRGRAAGGALLRCPRRRISRGSTSSAYGLGEDPAKVLLDEARVALSSGNDFGEHGAGFVRLNFATTQAILDEILDRIVERLGG